MIASKCLIPGETILEEVASWIGPGYGSHEYNLGYMSGNTVRPLCLGCCRYVVGGYACRLCKWPLCGSACMKEPWHKDFECPILARRKIRFSNGEKLSYYFISLLRGILLVKQKPEVFAKLKPTVDKRGAELAGKSGLVKMGSIARTVEKKFWLPAGSVDPLLVAGICRMLQVDGIAYVSHERSCTAIYAGMLTVGFSCIPTSRVNHYPPGDGRESYIIELYTIKPIEEKGEILRAHDESLLLKGSVPRRETLHEIFGHDCKCTRCADPTELGTYLSALKCPIKPCAGYFLPIQPLDYDEYSAWECSLCKHSASQRDISEYVDTYTVDVLQKTRVSKEDSRTRSALDNLTDGCERVLRKCEEDVHRHHYSLWPLRQALIGMLSEALPKLPLVTSNPNRMTREQCADKIMDQTQIMAVVLHKLIPGCCPIKGRVFYEMSKALNSILKACPKLMDPKYLTRKSMELFTASGLASFRKISDLPPEDGLDDPTDMIRDLEEWRRELKLQDVTAAFNFDFNLASFGGGEGGEAPAEPGTSAQENNGAETTPPESTGTESSQSETEISEGTLPEFSPSDTEISDFENPEPETTQIWSSEEFAEEAVIRFQELQLQTETSSNVEPVQLGLGSAMGETPEIDVGSLVTDFGEKLTLTERK